MAEYQRQKIPMDERSLEIAGWITYRVARLGRATTFDQLYTPTTVVPFCLIFTARPHCSHCSQCGPL